MIFRQSVFRARDFPGPGRGWYIIRMSSGGRSEGAGPRTRRAANCCLVLLVIPASLLAYFWYTVWHADHVNDERRQDALSWILGWSDKAADDTRHALGRSGSGADADALTGVIWRHSEAPLITYDPARRTFTATVRKTTVYDEQAVLLGGGPVQIARCFRLTFTRGSGSAWTSAAAVADDELCRASQQIGAWAHFAQQRITDMNATDLTPAGVRRALDPTGSLGYYDVKSAQREGRTATVTAVIRDARRANATAEQCYRFVRDLGTEGSVDDVTAVPLSTCPAAG